MQASGDAVATRPTAPSGTHLALPWTGMRERGRLTDAVFLTLLVATLLAWPLASPGISHHGEAREGVVVQDIVAHGHWVLPRRNGELPSKPPLFHWIAAGTTALFGAGDASLRLPSAVAALLAVLATYACGTAIGGRLVGWLAGGVLLGMVPFLTAAAEARVDMVLTAAITVALTAFLSWDEHGGAAARALVYAGVAAAVLAKGPAGAVIPALVIVVFLLVEGRGRSGRRRLVSLPLALGVLAVDAGWYALAWADGGPAFLRLQLVHENLERIVGSGDFHHSSHLHVERLAVALLVGLLPWSLVLVWDGIARARGRRGDRVTRFLHVWWMVVLGVFTIAAGKRAVYLLPACPAVALLAARRLAALVPTPDAAARRLPRRLVLALVAFDLGTLVVLQTVRELRARPRSLVPFADAVRATVPPATPLSVADTLGRDATLILAYRTGRPLALAHAPHTLGSFVLAPAAESGQRRWAGYTVVARSHRVVGPDIALLRASE